MSKARDFDDIVAFDRVDTKYPNSSAKQVTIKVRNNVTGDEIEIVSDYLVKDGSNYRIIDAKYTEADNFNVQNSLTPNQAEAFNLMKDPQANITIEVRANTDKLQQIDLEQGDIIPVNQIKIDIYKSKKGELEIDQEIPFKP